MIHIANRTYEVVVDHKNGWKPEAFRDRYSEVLERYDYIVGDWGYNQLRLRGFFKETHPKATKESSIATLQDYLNEYCNFGCAYFIIEKVPSKQQANPDAAGGTEGEEEAPASSQEEQVPSTATGAAQNAPAADAPKQPAQQQESKPSEHQHRERPHHHSKDKPHHRRNQHQQRNQGQGSSQNQNNKSPKQHEKQP